MHARKSVSIGTELSLGEDFFVFLNHPLGLSISPLVVKVRFLTPAKFMEVAQSSLLLKRVINIKAIVTDLWKEEAQKQLQAQINQIDSRLQQIEMQGQRMLSELQKQAASQQNSPLLNNQLADVQNRLNQDKSKLLQQKNQTLQQLQQVQTLELEKEVDQGKVESFFQVQVGDNLVKKLQVEVLIRDGIIQEIRGEL